MEEYIEAANTKWEELSERKENGEDVDEEMSALEAEVESKLKRWRRNELIKTFVSGFVGGCANYTVSRILTPMVPIRKPVNKVFDTAYTIMEKVGVQGISTLVGTKVAKDTGETIDSLIFLKNAAGERSRQKKEDLLEKKAVKKEKYVEVGEK